MQEKKGLLFFFKENNLFKEIICALLLAFEKSLIIISTLLPKWKQKKTPWSLPLLQKPSCHAIPIYVPDYCLLKGSSNISIYLSSTLKVKHIRTEDNESLALRDCWTTKNIGIWFPNKTLNSTLPCCTDNYRSEQFSLPWMHSKPFLHFLVTG